MTMTNEEKQFARIRAVVLTAADTVALAEDKVPDTAVNAKIWAFDLVSKMVEDPEYVPWQTEDWPMGYCPHQE